MPEGNPLGYITRGFKGLDPEVQRAILEGGFSAVGAGLSAGAQGKAAAADRQFQAQQAMLNRMGAPGSEPGNYAQLALRRAIFEGLPENANTSMFGQIDVPSEMRQFVPQMGPGIDLGPSRQAAQTWLGDEALLADQARRRQMEQQALQQVMQGQQQKKGGGFWGKLGGVLKFAAPIAAGFIPGIGPLAAAAIGGAGAGVGTKLQGGGWGDALVAGGMGAASSGLARAAAPQGPTIQSPSFASRFPQRNPFSNVRF
jgi:hypothetical protein